MRKLSILLLCIIFLTKISFAGIVDNDSASTNQLYPFYNHLLSEQLYDDAFTLLKNSRNHKTNEHLRDSITTSIAKLFIDLGYCDSAQVYFKQLRVINNPSVVSLAIETALTQNDTTAIDNYLNRYSNLICSSKLAQYRISLSMLKKQKIDSTFRDSSSITTIAKRYCEFKPKSTFVAAMLSTIIPGLGKRYLGYPKLAKGAFVTNVIPAAIMTEILLRTTKPFPIAASAFVFGTFYIGNIWGTVLLAKKREYDFYNQIDCDINNLYKDELCKRNEAITLITDNRTQTKNELLELEYKNWKSNNMDTICTSILTKSYILKQSGNSNKALNELQRLDRMPSFKMPTIVYENALNAYLLQNHNQCYNFLLEIPDSIRLHNKAIVRLWLLTLIENKQWEQCKNTLKNLCDSTNQLAIDIQKLPTSITFKSPVKALRLSSYFPGLGLFYTHQPLKAITSIVIETSCIAIATSLFIAGYYVTPLFIGIYPFLRFYIGGKELSYAKTLEWNNLREEECKKVYRTIVYQVTK